MRTPDYVLTVQVEEDLKAGTFVRPIRLEYLPKGWEEYVKGARWMSPETEVVCYTPAGLRIILKSNMRQV